MTDKLARKLQQRSVVIFLLNNVAHLPAQHVWDAWNMSDSIFRWTARRGYFTQTRHIFTRSHGSDETINQEVTSLVTSSCHRLYLDDPVYSVHHPSKSGKSSIPLYGVNTFWCVVFQWFASVRQRRAWGPGIKNYKKTTRGRLMPCFLFWDLFEIFYRINVIRVSGCFQKES